MYSPPGGDELTVKERIAYLRGLIEGSDFCGDNAQAKTIWESLLDICEDLADNLELLEADHSETEEYVETIDNDLADLEDFLFGFDDDEILLDDMVEMTCPECGEQVCFEEDFLYESDVEVSCPECGAVVYATGETVGNAQANGVAAEETAEDPEDED